MIVAITKPRSFPASSFDHSDDAIAFELIFEEVGLKLGACRILAEEFRVIFFAMRAIAIGKRDHREYIVGNGLSNHDANYWL